MDKEFDIDQHLNLRFILTKLRNNTPEARIRIRLSALQALEFAHKRDLSVTEKTFSSILNSAEHHLSYNQKTMAVEMCLQAANAYQNWCDEAVKTARASMGSGVKTTSSNLWGLHGGAHYTGNLPVGFAAPNGSESYRSFDDVRKGLEHWVRAVTGDNNGPGHSMGELSGKKNPKYNDIITSLEELRGMRKDALLRLMDTATNPANFLRAMLTYYNHLTDFKIGNVGGMYATSINNPKNLRVVTQMDTVFNYMKRIDDHDVLTSDRKARFLLLSDDVLSKVVVPTLRSENRLAIESHEETVRNLKFARLEISQELEFALTDSGMSAKDMRRRIESDKRGMSYDGNDISKKIQNQSPQNPGF